MENLEVNIIISKFDGWVLTDCDYAESLEYRQYWNNDRNDKETVYIEESYRRWDRR